MAAKNRMNLELRSRPQGWMSESRRLLSLETPRLQPTGPWPPLPLFYPSTPDRRRLFWETEPTGDGTNEPSRVAERELRWTSLSRSLNSNSSQLCSRRQVRPRCSQEGEREREREREREGSARGCATQRARSTPLPSRTRARWTCEGFGTFHSPSSNGTGRRHGERGREGEEREGGKGGRRRKRGRERRG